MPVDSILFHLLLKTNIMHGCCDTLVLSCVYIHMHIYVYSVGIFEFSSLSSI
jgi:hypothetical protein